MGPTIIAAGVGEVKHRGLGWSWGICKFNNLLFLFIPNLMEKEEDLDRHPAWIVEIF